MRDHMSPWRSVGRRLSILRAESGLTAAEAAALMDVSEAELAAWESGEARIDLDAAIRLAARTTATLDYIYLDDASTLPVPLAKAVAAADARDR